MTTPRKKYEFSHLNCYYTQRQQSAKTFSRLSRGENKDFHTARVKSFKILVTELWFDEKNKIS